MYGFANRGDFKVVDEPFYSYYLNLTKADHPGKKEIINSQPKDYKKVVESISIAQVKHENLFIKNMAHHLISLDLEFINQWENVILIRNPKQLIASFAQVIQNPTHIDIGVKRQYEIYLQLLEQKKNVTILDSDQLLKNPKSVLTQFCKKMNIEMNDNMLQWESGSIPEDGIWAKYWYFNVHNSKGFATQKTSSRQLPKHYQKLWKETIPYYEELSIHAIQP